MENAKVEIASAYVDPKNAVLNPEKLDGSALERMPQNNWQLWLLMSLSVVHFVTVMLNMESLGVRKVNGY